jgi:hypothetical protein
MTATLPTNGRQGEVFEVSGRIDQYGNVLLPVVIVAADGVELELEAIVNLQFAGALVVPDLLSQSVGWCCLGARKVLVGNQVTLMAHYLGLVAVGDEPKNVVALSAPDEVVMLGRKLLAGRKLTIDFERSLVRLEASCVDRDPCPSS